MTHPRDDTATDWGRVYHNIFVFITGYIAGSVFGGF